MSISDFAIRHPAIVGILLITLMVFGLLSFTGMSHDLLADITTPELLVFTVYPGASPEVVERDVTDPLEEEFSLIQGVNRLSSESHDGYSLIFVSLDWNADLEDGKNDIRDRIGNAMANLPEGISGAPRMYELGTSTLPVYSAIVESDLPDTQLARLLEDDIVPRMSRVKDVSAVYARGVEGAQVRVRLNPAKLESMDITALDVYQAVYRGQGAVPAGNVQVGADRLSFQSDGDYTTLVQLGQQAVGYTPEKLPVYLDDLADIYYGTENPEFRVSSGGRQAVALDVMKRSGGDTEKLVSSIHQLEEIITRESEGKVRFSPVVDDAQTIGVTLKSVGNSAWLGAVLAVIILLLFLHDLRASLIVTLSIPFTVFLTFILMRLRGMTLNMMTLAGITVAIGMMVDSSIVILENTIRHRTLGLNAFEAASTGAREVGGAVLASTSTSLSVFIPILFVSGLAGAILKEVAWVLLFALSSSALTAIIIVPWLSSRILGSNSDNTQVSGFGARFDTRFDRFAHFYGRVLTAALKHKTYVLLLSCTVILASFVVLGTLGAEMFSAPDMNEMEIIVELPAGYTLQDAEKKIAEIAALVREEVPEVQTDLWYSGIADSAAIVDKGNPSTGYGRIRLKRTTERERTVFDIIHHLNSVLPARITDAKIEVKNGGLAKQMNYATNGAGFRVELFGSNWDTVLSSASMLQSLMETDPLVAVARVGVRTDRELMDLNLDRITSSRLGINPVLAGQNLRILFNGEEAGQVEVNNLTYPIFIDSTLADGQMPDGILGRIRARNGAGTTVPYSAFSSAGRRIISDKIPHRDRLPSLVVAGELIENDLAGVQSRLVPQLEKMDFPPGVNWRIVGVADVMGETFTELGRALGIAVFLVYAVMVIQFEKFRQPFIIMASVPFVLIGVAAALAGFGGKLSMMTLFGIIALGGMVVNNAIVLVEMANQKRNEGNAVREALVEACSIRLKPIMITTLTTVLGLIPLAFAIGEGSDIYAPLGQLIGGGLITSTLITLILVPVLYEILEGRQKHSRKKA